MWGIELSLLWKNFCMQYSYFPVCWSPTQRVQDLVLLPDLPQMNKVLKKYMQLSDSLLFLPSPPFLAIPSTQDYYLAEKLATEIPLSLKDSLSIDYPTGVLQRDVH